jgi:A/G-specific adenine glycosylase
MVSEFMLQQTQTTRVIPKYKAFIDKFSTLESLANSDTVDVLQLWSGLGYNRRALWLKEAAQKLVALGKFPTNYKELKKIKGIGDYTSRAILIFAFNENLATVDTNIRRIFIHEGFAREDTKERELYEIAENLLPKNRSRDYHSALMDYGNEILTSAKSKIKPKTKQGKFEGSNRQYRGKIVKYLTDKKGYIAKEKITLDCKIPDEKIDHILEKLIKDGMVKKGEKNDYSIS